MPLRGESVGTAYVRVLADGTGFPQSLRDEFDKADGVFDDAGSVGAKRYKESFAQEMESHTGRSLDDALSDALARDDFAKDFFESDAWHKFETNMHARFGGIGTDAADELREKFIHQGSLQGIESDIERIVSRINNNVDRAIAESDREAARVRKLGEDFRAVWNDVEDDTEKAGNALTRFFGRFRSGAKDVDSNEHFFIRFSQTIDRLADSTGRAFGKGSRSELLNFIGSFTGGAVRMLGLFPRLLGNIGEFATGFRTALSEGEGFFSAMKTGFTTMASDAEGGATAFSKLTSTGIPGIIGLGVALVGLVSVLSIVASLISGIAAALIAMTSTIAFGAVAAIAALGALLPPIALGIGAVVLAVKTLDDQSKKALSEAVKPLLDGLKSLGETAREGFLQTFNADISDMSDELRTLHPLVEGIGEAFGHIGNNVVGAFDSPTFRRFVNQMTVFVPQALELMASIAGNVGQAITAIFTDSIPLARQFLHWLDGVTGDFADFITSNPKEVTDFLERASHSAKSLGDFLAAAGRVLGDLFFSKSGQKAGNGIFDDMTENLNKFDDFLDKHPDALGDFFKNGRRVAQDIGDIAVSLGDIFDSLDSPEGRKNLHDLLRVLTGISELAGPLAFIANLSFNFSPLLTLLSGKVNTDGLRNIGHQVDNFIQKFQVKPGFAHGLIAWIPGVTSDIVRFVRRTGRNVDQFIQKFQVGPGFAHGLVSWIPGALGSIGNFFLRIGHLDADAMNGLVTRAHTAANNVVRFLTSIPGRLNGLVGRFTSLGADWAEAVFNQIQDLPGRIVGLFTGLAGRIVSAIGDINIPIHISAPGPLARFLPHTATGGTFSGAQMRVIAEKGREAVVPLDRPLDQVDPSVRWLSALAQGKIPLGTDVTHSSGRSDVTNHWHIVTPTEDPKAVAIELLNRMVASVA